jgi:hypothetical protein
MAVRKAVLVEKTTLNQVLCSLPTLDMPTGVDERRENKVKRSGYL